MGFPIPVRWHLYFESGPWSQRSKYNEFEMSFWRIFCHWLCPKLSNVSFRCSQWQKFHQNDGISIAVITLWDISVDNWILNTSKHVCVIKIVDLQRQMSDNLFHFIIVYCSKHSLFSSKYSQWIPSACPWEQNMWCILCKYSVCYTGLCVVVFSIKPSPVEIHSEI